MRKLKVAELKRGMVVAEDVYSPKGQLLVKKDTSLSTQMIAHLNYYGTPHANIIDKGVPPEAVQSIEKTQSAITSYSQRIRESKEFQIFEKDYFPKVTSLKESLNDFIVKNIELDTENLIRETSSLFQKNSTTFSMFDMLHNMHQLDDSTYAHSLNVSIICRMIGMWSGFTAQEQDTLTLCGLLHDVGKARIPESIIGKPGKLTEREYQIIQLHPVLGHKLLQNQSLDDHVKNAALMHHERYDGTGYPHRLKGSQLDEYACIIAIADVYDAMTSNRCYRPALCPFEVISLFESEGLQRYHPQYILTFLERIANTYVNNDVLLNNGETGKIILIHNDKLTRPVVQLDQNHFIDLEERLDLYVQAII